MSALPDGARAARRRGGTHLYISRWQKVEAERISTGARAHYVPRKIARLEKAGARFVGRGGSYPLIRELLGRGETCWLAIDTVATGRGRETTLAGRRVRLATGLASLALETGVPVVRAFAYRDRWRPAARLLDPVDPTGFDDLDSLHEHLARIASDAIEERRAHMMPDLALALELGRPLKRNRPAGGWAGRFRFGSEDQRLRRSA